MNCEILLVFLLGMIVLSATPGIGVLASVSKALSEGFKSSLIFIGGLVIGDIIFFLLALIGISAISRLMGQLFFVIKIIGGVYLIYLGVNTIKRRKKEAAFDDLKRSGYKSLTGGLLVTLGNPKPILFYASIVPAIIDINQIQIYEVVAIIFIIFAVSFIVIGSYCYLATVSKSILMRKQYQNRINAVSGMTMITVGVFIIFKRG